MKKHTNETSTIIPAQVVSKRIGEGWPIFAAKEIPIYDSVKLGLECKELKTIFRYSDYFKTDTYLEIIGGIVK